MLFADLNFSGQVLLLLLFLFCFIFYIIIIIIIIKSISRAPKSY